jgi:hypothetical protein
VGWPLSQWAARSSALPVFCDVEGDTGGDMTRMGREGPVYETGLAADAATGVMWRLTVTLSETAGTVTTVALKAGVTGIRINPGTNDVGFAFDENPVAAATSSSTSIADTAWSVGNTAHANQIEARLIDGESDIRLTSTTASHVVKLEILF